MNLYRSVIAPIFYLLIQPTMIQHNNFLSCVMQKDIQDEINNIKQHFIDKRHAYRIIKDCFWYYNINEIKYTYKNFTNFWEYEKARKNDKLYFRQYKTFLRAKKENLQWYYDYNTNDKRKYKLFTY